MKNIVIKVKWLKREAIIIMICYLFANLLNISAIAYYDTAWNEIFTKQEIVLYITEWLYIASIVIRLMLYVIKYIMK